MNDNQRICKLCKKAVPLQDFSPTYQLCIKCMGGERESPPEEKLFEEWVTEMERLNYRNIAEMNQLMITTIQWNELKVIVNNMQRGIEEIEENAKKEISNG